MLDRSDLFMYLLPLVLILTGVYIFSPQIDYKWYSKHPSRLNKKDRLLLEKISGFYSSLDEQEKERFEKRAYVYMRSKEFKLIQDETKSMPEDIKLMIVANAIQLTFGLEDYQYGHYDRYFAYMHAFPSPKKKFLHSVEVDTEDKMAIFNIEVLTLGMNPNNNFFNIGLYAFAIIFLDINSNKYLDITEDKHIWEKINEFDNMDKEKITNIIGYEPPSVIPVIITLFFMNKKKFAEVFPEYYDKFISIFNIS